ncbi:hypothetical protein ACWV26_03215 [Rummeliibacillus sp. JY-2-4R]
MMVFSKGDRVKIIHINYHHARVNQQMPIIEGDGDAYNTKQDDGNLVLLYDEIEILFFN